MFHSQRTGRDSCEGATPSSGPAQQKHEEEQEEEEEEEESEEEAQEEVEEEEAEDCTRFSKLFCLGAVGFPGAGSWLCCLGQSMWGQLASLLRLSQ